MLYRTEDAAIRRIEQLKLVGVWPGYFRMPGGWALTYDPPNISSRSDYEGSVW